MTSERALVAVALAEAGFPVIPWNREGGGATHVSGGYGAASADPQTVRRWWSRWPNAVPGVYWQDTNIVCLDYDRHDGKPDGVATAMGQFGHDAAKDAISTPSGGYHQHFLQPGPTLSGLVSPFGVAPGIDRLSDHSRFEGFYGSVADVGRIAARSLPALPDWATGGGVANQPGVKAGAFNEPEWWARTTRPDDPATDYADLIAESATTSTRMLGLTTAWAGRAYAGLPGSRSALIAMEAAYCSISHNDNLSDSARFQHLWSSAAAKARGRVEAMFPETDGAEEDPDEDGDVVASAGLERDVLKEVRRITVREIAAERLRQERYAACAPPIPSLLTLDRVLAQPRPASTFLVEGLWPYDGTTLHIAQRKTGKTALCVNLTRSLVDGDPFLGRFACAGGERVAVVNLEDPANAFADLLERQRIVDVSSVLPVSLNGNARAFDVMTDQGRARWASALGSEGITVLIVDPLKPLIDAFGLDEWRQTGELFNAIKACARDAGINHVHVSHHAGHSSEGGRVRARGDSSLEGTADALWFSTMDDPTDARSIRQFSALGRGVSVDRGALLLDAATGRQTYTTKASGLVALKRSAVVDYLTKGGPATRQELIDNIGGVDKNNVKAVLDALAASGEVVQTIDPGSAHTKRYSLPAGPGEMFPEEERSGVTDGPLDV